MGVGCWILEIVSVVPGTGMNVAVTHIGRRMNDFKDWEHQKDWGTQ